MDGLAGVRHVEASPDGRHLYAAGNDDDAVSVFAIGAGGALRFEQVLKDDSIGGAADGLQSARDLAVSPDGANVYVASYNEFAASAFARDPLSGHLAFLNEVAGPPCCGVFISLNEVAVSPDGGDVYTVSNGRAAALDRGAGGALSLRDWYSEGSDSFGRGFALAVSPDGAHVYVAHDTSLEVAQRDATGALSFVTQYDDGLGGVDGLDQPESIAISADGLDVYVGTFADRSITHFGRDPGSGLLAFRETLIDLDACPNANELLMWPDDSGLVASCLTTLVLYLRDPATGALEVGLSIPQQAIGAVQIHSAAVVGERIYVASQGTDSIVVIGAPEPGCAAAGASALAVLAAGALARRERSCAPR